MWLFRPCELTWSHFYKFTHYLLLLRHGNIVYLLYCSNLFCNVFSKCFFYVSVHNSTLTYCVNHTLATAVFLQVLTHIFILDNLCRIIFVLGPWSRTARVGRAPVIRSLVRSSTTSALAAPSTTGRCEHSRRWQPTDNKLNPPGNICNRHGPVATFPVRAF